MAEHAVERVAVPSPTSAVARQAALLAAVTAVVFAVELLRDPSGAEAAPLVTLVWLVALLLAAPVVAYLANRRRPVAVDVTRAALVAMPQLPVVVALMAVDVWLDVQRGYLAAGSGEEAMSYGIGVTVSTVAGLVLVALVAGSARLGARR
jgi:hypothetical protein